MVHLDEFLDEFSTCISEFREHILCVFEEYLGYFGSTEIRASLIAVKLFSKACIATYGAYRELQKILIIRITVPPSLNVSTLHLSVKHCPS